MRGETLELVAANRLEKGDVLGVARVAGIMAAKNTSQLVPLCHPLPLDQVLVEFGLDRERGAVDITATARTTAKTGVEMEALAAVSVAALTIYDMCKSSDRAMRIDGVPVGQKERRQERRLRPRAMTGRPRNAQDTGPLGGGRSERSAGR